MKTKRNHYKMSLLLATLCSLGQLSQATPIGSDTLVYQGAVFTLDSGWDGARYLVTYRANFSTFQGEENEFYLKAIDWNWIDGDLGDVTLTAAPGDLRDWVARSNQQISVGDSPGCETGGGSDAVCAEYIGDAKGFSTFGSTEDLSWVFEVGFKTIRQKDVFFGGGFGAAIVNGSGKLTAPTMSCSGAQNPGCPDQRIEVQALAEDNGNVPIPGVPALLLAGIAGMFMMGRRRGGGLKG